MLMITFSADFCNPVSQDLYDSLVSSLQLHQLTCPCGHSGCLMVHGYYSRSLKQGTGVIRLSICRVKCSVCSRTHALLPAFIVPYSQISLPEQAQIIQHSENHSSVQPVLEQTPSIDENNVSSILRRYRKHWRQRLLSESIPLHPLEQLVSCCFASFKRQFLQIKSTPNLLFIHTT